MRIAQTMQKLLTKFTLLALYGWIMVACNNKEDVTLPGVTTRAISDLAGPSVTFNGTYTTAGEGGAITDHGFVYSTSPNPVAGSATEVSLGALSDIGAFSNTQNQLALNATYYVKAFVKNSTGYFYGEEVSFNTGLLKFTSINPVFGGLGTEVTIKGENFGSDAASNKVTFGDKVATIIKSTPDSLVVQVPADATPWQTIDVKVEVGGSQFTQAFTITGWAKKNDFGGGKIALSAGFVINNKGYIVGGRNESIGFQKATWEYDPLNDQWTQKQDFPEAIGIANHQGFSVGNTGYVTWGKGYLWQYNPTNNSWVEKEKDPCGSCYRYYAFSFTIGSNFFIGGGNDLASTGNDQAMWLYDTTNETWTQLKNVPFAANLAPSFTIGSDVYVAETEQSIITNTKKGFWHYNIDTDTWTQKTDFAGSSRSQSVGFSDDRNRKGYIGLGYDGTTIYKDMWQYDQNTNTWTQLTGDMGDEIANPTVLKINEEVFLVGGGIIESNGNYTKQSKSVWKFTFPTN